MIETCGGVVFLRDSDGKPLQIAVEGGRIIGHIFRHRGGITPVVSGHGIEQMGTIGYVFGQGADLVQRRGKRHKTVP